MRHFIVLILLASCLPFLGQSVPSTDSQPDEGPTSEKAKKTYQEALAYLAKHMTGPALDSFKKADKQDGERCLACQKKMLKYAVQLRDWKVVDAAAGEMLRDAQGDSNIALAHYQYGLALMYEGLDRHKQEVFSQAHDELSKALATVSNFPDAVYVDGRVLAHLNRDDEAKSQFQRYVQMPGADPLSCERALHYISEPELARERMAPPFAVTTSDGQHISLDDLHGKVVLIDFWATWCGPCMAALPHIREIANKFHGQPLVLLSIGLDTDEHKWRDFIVKKEMTWPQYFDGGFTGPVATAFGVRAIPHTFTIDADGVLQDEHIGDASIEGKLKKLVARARELQTSAK